jgi:hypothetical protein
VLFGWNISGRRHALSSTIVCEPAYNRLARGAAMFLELFQVVSFVFSLLSLYWVTISAFFVPGSRWQDRLTVALLRLALAACVCFFSGLLFSWPKRRQRFHPSLLSTLPVQLFFWALAGIAVLFVSSWYIASYPCTINATNDCSF